MQTEFLGSTSTRVSRSHIDSRESDSELLTTDSSLKLLEDPLLTLPPTMDSPQLDSAMKWLLPDPMLPPILDSTTLDSKSWTRAIAHGFGEPDPSFSSMMVSDSSRLDMLSDPMLVPNWVQHHRIHFDFRKIHKLLTRALLKTEQTANENLRSQK